MANSISKNSQPYNFRDTICYSCQGKGHISKYCPLRADKKGGLNMNTDNNPQRNIPKQNTVGDFTGGKTGSDGLN